MLFRGARLSWFLPCLLIATPVVGNYNEFECFGADEELVRLQLYVGSTPGASWELDCEGQLVWNHFSDATSSWIFEHYCIVPSTDRCQFSIQASGDTFFALVVGATTIAVSSKEVEAVDQLLCFGANCEQGPLEIVSTDDDDADPASRSPRDDTAAPSMGLSSALIRQKSFIMWLVATSITLVTVLLAWHCSLKIRRLNAVEESRKEDDETLREDGYD